jgi:hypothetical protein
VRGYGMAEIKSGVSVSWGASHKTSDGRLIVRNVNVQPPQFGACLVLTCMWRYFKAQLIYVLTLLYHQYRTECAEKYRDKDIPMDYRTGENVPETFWRLVWAIMRIPH